MKNTNRISYAARGFTALLMLCVAPFSGAQFNWPEGTLAAVSLGYDDALDSQLDNALPALNRYNFKATFYLTLSSPTITARLSEWRQAVKQGHELGNHSINHPCRASLPGREWVAAQNNLDNWSVAMMVQEIENANRFLFAIDGEMQRTFTPPCGDKRAKDGGYLEKVAPLFPAIRRPGPPIVSMQRLDLHNTPTWFAVDPSLKELTDYVEQAASHGTLASITFHGVGGDHLAVSAQVHEQFLAWLDARRDQYRVDSLINLSRYIRQQSTE